MGNWVTISTAGASGYTPPPDAPNITGVSASAYYGLLGNDSVFGLQGTISLPTAHAAYSHLKQIEITALLPNGSRVLVDSLYAPFSGSTVTFTGPCEIPQTGADQTAVLRLVCKNDVGLATASPVTANVTAQASSVTGFTSAAEAGTPEVDPKDRLVYTFVDFVPILNNGQVPQSVTYAISEDGGTSYTHITAVRITAVGQTVRIRRPKPSAPTTWKIAATTGWLPGDPSKKIAAPSGWTVSSGFTVSTVSAPAANSVTSASIANLPDTGTKYALRKRADGSYFGEIGLVQWTDPTSTDFFVRVTTEELDSSHVSLAAGGGERVHDGFMVAGAGGTARTTARTLLIDLKPGLAYVRYRIYLANRNSQGDGDFVNAATNTKQTCWTGANYYDMAVTLPGGFDAKYADPTTLSASLVQRPDGLGVNSTDLSNMVLNGDFSNNEAGWTLTNASIFAAYGYVSVPCVRLTQNTGSLAEKMPHACTPGSTYYCEARVSSDVGAGRTLFLTVLWLNGNGALITSDVAGSVGGSSALGFTLLSGTVTAPAATASCMIYVTAQGGADDGVHYWYVDCIYMQPQIKTGLTGPGVHINPTTGLMEVNDVNISMFASTVRPIAIFSANPTLPDAKYPSGTFGKNVVSGEFLKVNAAGNAWVKAVDGGTDIVASSITVNELNVASISAAFASITYLSANYATISALAAKTITADKITGGVCSATVSFTAPDITVTSGTTTVKINGTDFIKVADTFYGRTAYLAGQSVRIERTADTSNYAQLTPGACQVAGNGGANPSTLGAGFLNISGQQVMGPRIGTRPVTLADVIDAGVTHGWWA